jgi:hypothetical protein
MIAAAEFYDICRVPLCAPPMESVCEPTDKALTVAVVGSRRLIDRLLPEVAVVVPTKQNSRQCLLSDLTRLLIVETCFETFGNWGSYDLFTRSDALSKAIADFRSGGGTAILWCSLGSPYHHLFDETLPLFDRIIVEADSERFPVQDSRVLRTGFLVQPSISNCFRAAGFHPAARPEVIFDGWADLDRFAGAEHVVDTGGDRVVIVDSQFDFLWNRRNECSPEYKRRILGSLPEIDLFYLLPMYQGLVQYSGGLRTEATLEFLSVQAAAMGTPAFIFDPQQKDIANRGSALIQRGSPEAFRAWLDDPPSESERARSRNRLVSERHIARVLSELTGVPLLPIRVAVALDGPPSSHLVARLDSHAFPGLCEIEAICGEHGAPTFHDFEVFVLDVGTFLANLDSLIYALICRRPAMVVMSGDPRNAENHEMTRLDAIAVKASAGTIMRRNAGHSRLDQQVRVFR